MMEYMREELGWREKQTAAEGRPLYPHLAAEQGLLRCDARSKTLTAIAAVEDKGASVHRQRRISVSSMDGLMHAWMLAYMHTSTATGDWPSDGRDGGVYAEWPRTVAPGPPPTC